MNISSSKTTIQTSGLILTFFLLSFLVVFAQENTEGSVVDSVETEESTSTRPDREMIQNRQDNIETRQEERAEAVEERQEARTGAIEERQATRNERQIALTEIRQQRILNLSANLSNRMESAIERLFNIVDRLEERIAKIKQTGVNTDLAEAKLREAAQLLAEARARLANIDNLVFSATTATEPKSEWQVVRQIYIDCGNIIRRSHQALRDTIALLKSAIADAEGNRNSAPESNSNQSTSTPVE